MTMIGISRRGTRRVAGRKDGLIGGFKSKYEYKSKNKSKWKWHKYK